VTTAEIERLAIMAEEMGEALQMIGKTLRHGYESVNPDLPISPDNRTFLEKELGDVLFGIQFLASNGDIVMKNVEMRAIGKARQVKRYLHHEHIMPDDGGSR